MNLHTLISLLANTNHSEFTFQSGLTLLPAHFHITEVAKTKKDFIDCGGQLRSETTCVLQTFVANDIDHRLSPKKLLGILQKAESLGIDPDCQVEVEVQGKTIETYTVSDKVNDIGKLVLNLNAKQTDCLAKDKCGLEIVTDTQSACCSATDNCC